MVPCCFLCSSFSLCFSDINTGRGYGSVATVLAKHAQSPEPYAQARHKLTWCCIHKLTTGTSSTTELEANLCYIKHTTTNNNNKPYGSIPSHTGEILGSLLNSHCLLPQQHYVSLSSSPKPLTLALIQEASPIHLL